MTGSERIRESLARSPEPSDQRRRFGASAPALFLPATRNEPDGIGMALDQQRANPGRSADLVSRDSHHIGGRGGKVQIELAESLHRINDENMGRWLHNRLYTPARLYDAGFVVDPGKGHQQLFAGIAGIVDMPPQCIEIDDPVL